MFSTRTTLDQVTLLSNMGDSLHNLVVLITGKLWVKMKWCCFCLRSNTCWCPHVSNHFAAPNTNVWWDHHTHHLDIAFEVVAVAVGEAAIHCVYRPGIIQGFSEYQKMRYAIICIQTEWRCDNGNMCYHNHKKHSNNNTGHTVSMLRLFRQLCNGNGYHAMRIFVDRTKAFDTVGHEILFVQIRSLWHSWPR